MKRINNLYSKLYDINNLLQVFVIVSKKTNNKRKVSLSKDNKVSIITKAYNDLINKSYMPGEYREFYIYEPKKRLIIETNMYDKYINHLVSEVILKESILNCLVDSNVASRKNKGTKYGLYLYYKYLSYYKRKYQEFYILKIDIKGFFSNIDHDILINKLKRRIKDQDAIDILTKIINSYHQGLSIGLYSSQLLSIFYLNDLDYYIKEELNIKHYIRYQDDIVIFHHNKEYLKEVLNIIKEELKKIKLEVNNKTKIYKHNENINYLGRKKNGKKSRCYMVNRKLKRRYYQYRNDEIKLNSLISSINSINNNKVYKGGK